MNREIKFRCWDKEDNKMLSHEDLKDINWSYSELTKENDNYVLMQYTGLKDKNGVEIYENDLFGKMGGNKERPNEYEITSEVIFDTDFLQFCVEYTNGGWSTLWEHLDGKGNSKEIIGNIYENKELLGD